MTRRWTARWSGPASAVVVAVIAIIVLFTAYGYSRSSGLFPIFIGWIFLGLALVEAALRLRDFAAGDVRLPHDASTGLEEVETAGPLRDLLGFGWLLAFLLAIWLLGFLLATALFLFAFLRLAGGRSWRYAGAAALLAVLIVWGVFSVLLEYRLFAGLLFGA